MARQRRRDWREELMEVVESYGREAASTHLKIPRGTIDCWISEHRHPRGLTRDGLFYRLDRFWANKPIEE